MLLDKQVLTFTLVAAVLTVTPGADTMLVIRNSLRGGRAAGWATTLGILSGTFLHALMSSVGLSVILMRSATVFHYVKLLGAAYLVWLGLHALWSTRRDSGAPSGSETNSVRRVMFREGYVQGFLTNILNPKVAVFYLAFLPQFISPGDPVLAKSVLLAGIHNLQGVLWLGALSIVVARGRRWMERPAVRRWVTRVSGTIIAGLGIRLALED